MPEIGELGFHPLLDDDEPRHRAAFSRFSFFLWMKQGRRTAGLAILAILAVAVIIALILTATHYYPSSSPSDPPVISLTRDNCSASGLVGVVYLYHGTMTLDPTMLDLPPGAAELHAAGRRISARVARLQPEVIVLVTPHGLSLASSSLVYLNNGSASGTSEWLSTWAGYTVSVPMAAADSAALLTQLRQDYNAAPENRTNAEGLTAFSGASTPLRWAETVPLYFALHDWLQQYDSSSPRQSIDASLLPRPPRLIVLSTAGLSRYRGVAGIELGRSVRRFIQRQLPNQRVLLLLSGDLAHTHAWSTSLPAIFQPPSPADLPPQGGPLADAFDGNVSAWMTGRTGAVSNATDAVFTLDAGWLLNRVGSMLSAAVCGYS